LRTLKVVTKHLEANNVASALHTGYLKTLLGQESDDDEHEYTLEQLDQHEIALGEAIEEFAEHADAWATRT
jgi:hypothetical protein